ncbi:hypothetical protein B0H10DRAFT_1948876 [Mycena sp. CBHHK59/15]|nr:hypothetical protein B0H10DRAFT_1948876 [Mycena sp. CBHHK59/15]
MQKLPELIQYVEDKQLRGAYIGSLFTSWPECAVPDPDALIVEGIQCFQQANDTSGEARFNVALGYFFGLQNDIPKATRFLTSGLLGSRHLGDAILQSLALRQLAEINNRLGNNRLGQEQAHESHKLAQLSGHFHSAAYSMLAEGSCHISLGNYPRAQRLFKDARNLLAVCGLQGSMRDLRIANFEAEVAYLQSEYTESRRIRVSIVEFGDRAPFAHLYALINLACTDISMGADEHQVRKSLDAARSVCVSMSYSRGFEACDIILAQLHLSQGRLTEAHTLFEQSFNLIRERDVEGSLLCLEALGDPNNGMGNLDSTFTWTVILLGVGLQGRNMLAIYRAFRCLGDTFSEQGDKDTALTLFETALEGFTAMEIHRGKADCLVRIGDIWKYRGHSETAETFWKAARPLFQRSSQGKDVAKVDDRLAAGNLECI